MLAGHGGMKVYALLSWFDERPEHLRRCVRSLKGFADVLVAVDGAYSTFPHAIPESPVVQHWTLSDAVSAAGLGRCLISPGTSPWNSETEKRAAMFEYARTAGATPEDWFLIIDADMALGHYAPETRNLLAASDADVADVRFQNVQIDGKVAGTYRFRSMFRAIPGLTVERTHYHYTAPEDTDHTHRSGRRFLWHLPNGHLSDEPIVDLYDSVTLQHFNSGREPERRQRALDYYKDRDARTLESVGDWR